MKCKHPKDALVWTDITREFVVPADSEVAVFLACKACGLCLPFGPARGCDSGSRRSCTPPRL